MKLIIVAWQGVLSEPLKSILAVVALTLGMLGFVTVTSAQGVLEQTVQRHALLQGGAAATFRAQVETPSAAALEVFREQVSTALAAAATITADAPDLALWADGVPAPELGIHFVDENFRAVRPLPVLYGEWPTDSRYLAPRVVVNTAARETLDVTARYELGAGRSRTAVVISGVVDDGESSPNAYLDWRVLGDFAGEDVRYAISLTGSKLTGAAIQAAGQQLGEFGSVVTIVELHETDTISSLTTELRTTGQVLLVLALLSIGSTIVGVTNVGLSTVRTRTREYSLRRALGASRRQIAIITVIESQIVALVAAGVAFGLSGLTYPFVASLFSAPSGTIIPEFPMSTGWLCLVVASATGLVASVAPAIQASGPDVSSVMRV